MKLSLQRIYRKENEQSHLNVHDLMKSFVAGLLRVNPDVDLDELKVNLALEFQVAPEHLLLYGEWPQLRVWTHPDSHDDLKERYGSSCLPVESDSSVFENIRNTEYWNN